MRTVTGLTTFLLICVVLFTSGCATPYEEALERTRTGRRMLVQGKKDQAFQKLCNALFDLKKQVDKNDELRPERRLLLAVLYHSLARLDGQKRYLEKGQGCKGLESINADYLMDYPREGVPLLDFAFQEILIVRDLVRKLDPEKVSAWVDVQTDMITGDQFYRLGAKSKLPDELEVREIVPDRFAHLIWKWGHYRNSVEFYLASWKYFPKVRARELLGKPQDRLRDAFGSLSSVLERLATMSDVNQEARDWLNELSEEYQGKALRVETERNMSGFGMSPSQPYVRLNPLSAVKRGRNTISAAQRFNRKGRLEKSRNLYIKAIRHLLLAHALGSGFENLHFTPNKLKRLSEKKKVRRSILRPLGDALLNIYRLVSK